MDCLLAANVNHFECFSDMKKAHFPVRLNINRRFFHVVGTTSRRTRPIVGKARTKIVSGYIRQRSNLSQFFRQFQKLSMASIETQPLSNIQNAFKKYSFKFK